MNPLGRATFPTLGTDAVVLTTVADKLDAAVRAVTAEVDAIDRTCSRFRDDSDLSRVNAAAGRVTSVDPLFLDALDVALRAAKMSRGVVDPTIGEAVRVLGYDRDFATLVSPVPTAPVLHLTKVPGWHRVHVDRSNGTVKIPAGCRLDLGATAKAFAADRAAAAAAIAAGCGVLVSLGGDLSTSGPAPAGGWLVRVSDWQGNDVDADGQSVAITVGALATSSTTVRRWVRGDETVHHLIDPATGSSCAIVWRTVSVAAANCVDANVAATAAIILGEAAPAWLNTIHLPVRLVRVDGTVEYLNGWEAQAA